MSDDPKKRLPEKRGLGRGLAALMGESAGTATPADAARGALREIPVEQLMPNPYQPRKVFAHEPLAQLAASIRERGVLQPLLVRRSRERAGMYEIIAGERRWRAAQLARLHAVPAVVREIDNRQALEAGLIENIQRENLNPLEEAQAYRRLMTEFAYTQETVADAVGKSRSHVANTLRLLTLPDSVLLLMAEGRITPGQVRPLIGHPQAPALAERIAGGQLSARQVEALVKAGRTVTGSGRKTGGGAGPRPVPAQKDADTRAFERSLSEALGLVVEIEAGPGGESGRLIISYATIEQLDDLAKKLSRR